MKYYHGTSVPNLTVLQPHPTYYQKTPYVYLSSNEVVASFYIFKRDYMWFTYGFTNEGIPEYTETYKGNLEEFYGGLSGTIYICEGDFTASGIGSIPTAVTLEKPIPVIDSIPVENCLKKFCEYESEGQLIIHRFENLTEKQRECNSRMVLNSIHDLKLLEGKHPLSGFVKEKFPDLWEIALNTVYN